MRCTSKVGWPEKTDVNGYLTLHEEEVRLNDEAYDSITYHSCNTKSLLASVHLYSHCSRRTVRLIESPTCSARSLGM